MQAALDAGIRNIQLVSPGEQATGFYAAVYTDDNGRVVAESDDRFLHIAAGKNIVLDLNGHTIDRNLSVSTGDGNVMRVEGALTLEDSAGGGTVRGGNNYASGAEGGGVLVADGGEFTLTGGQIAGNQGYYGGGVAVAEGGTFTMNGGRVSGNNAAYGGGVMNNGEFALHSGAVVENEAIIGGGVFNNESGGVTMNGGTVSGNTAYGDGGGVANYNAFTMSGGAISGNYATNGGGVASVDMGDVNAFALNGGAICDNEAEDVGGGVMLYGGEFAVSGSFDLYGNTADGEQGNVYLSEDTLITVAGPLELSAPIRVATEAAPTGSAPVVLTDGLPGNAATSDFASENPDYEVQLNSAGEAVLALPSPELLTPPAANALTYNGAAQALITAGTADNGTLVYKLGDSGAYSAVPPTATNAGRYTVYYKVAGENGVADTSEQSLAATIAPKPLTDAMVTAGTVSTVYSGAPQANSVTVTDGDRTLSAGTDYGISGDTATNAGTYTASVTGKGNYTGTVEKTWSITPAGIRPSVALDGWTYGDAANTPVVGGNSGNGAVLIGYKPRTAADEAYSSAVPVSAGEYTVRVRIAATGNYAAGEASANFTIAKRPAAVTAAAQSVMEGGAIDDSVTRAALSGAVSGHTLGAVTLTSTSTDTPTTAGTVTPSDARIVRSGTDVTENYDITYVGGTLTVEKVIRSYPVTFYADSAGETVSQQHDVLSGETLSAYADLRLENDARRTFAGWSLESNVTEYKGNEGKILDFNGFTMPEEAVSIYPVWVENQLNVRLDLGAYDEQNTQSWYDSSQYDPATPAYMEAVRNRNFWERAGALISMARINAATRPGYTLDGWYTQGGVPWDASWKLDPEYCDRAPDGTVILLEDTEYRNFYYVVTLTAKWTPEPIKASVYYDLNGGTGTVEDGAVYVPNDKITLSTVAPAPPEGKLFLGWLDSAGNLYQPGGVFTYSSEALLSLRDDEEWLVLTARYEDIPEPIYSTITFDTEGGSMVAPVTLEPGETVTAPAAPTRTGYTFAGWSPALPATMPDTDITATAQWTPNRYTITFDTGRGSAVTPMTQDFDTPITPPANPALTGYSFVAWNPVLPATMPAQDLTVKAVWVSIRIQSRLTRTAAVKPGP